MSNRNSDDDDQRDLFNIAPNDDDRPTFEAYTRARSSDPITSHEAAERIVKTLREKQQIVLGIYRDPAHATGLTLWELETITGSHTTSTWRTRVSELAELGWLVKAGTRRVSGSNDPTAPRVVWVYRGFVKGAQ